MTHYLGIDIGKETFHAALVDGEGVMLDSAEFANDAAGFVKLIAWLKNPAETIGLCEPTGSYGKRLQQALVPALASLHEVNAAVIKRACSSQVRTKTDAADARMIACVARKFHLTEPKILEQNRVICDLQREDLALWLHEHDRLRKNGAAIRQQIADLDQQIAPAAPKVRQRRCDELAALLKAQDEVREELIRCYEEMDDRQAALIDSIPGLGPLSTAALLVVVGDINRFESADALKAYLGVYPCRNQSGKREGQAHMAKHGNQLVKHILWNAAKAAVNVKHPHNPFRALYDRLRAKGKSGPTAYAAVCRKLVQVIFGVLKSQTPYQFPAPTP